MRCCWLGCQFWRISIVWQDLSPKKILIPFLKNKYLNLLLNNKSIFKNYSILHLEMPRKLFFFYYTRYDLDHPPDFNFRILLLFLLQYSLAHFHSRSHSVAYSTLISEVSRVSHQLVSLSLAWHPQGVQGEDNNNTPQYVYISISTEGRGGSLRL